MTAALASVSAWKGIDLIPSQTRSSSTEGMSVERLVRHMAAIVLIVAIAVVLIAGIVAYSLIAYQCVKHGYQHVAWYGPNGWKFWELKIICTR